MIFVDLDGVMADFDRHYFETFGIKTSKELDDVDWNLVNSVPGFYADIPPMPDFKDLWDFVKPLTPAVLTGVPKAVPGAAADKIKWVAKHLGFNTRVVTCQSKEKWRFALEGDILIDDWTKYQHLWVGAGGRWITHTSAAETIRQLQEIL